MVFERIEPSPDLSAFIECYWMARDEDPTPRKQKIIPDGYTEIIFHTGDPYKVNFGEGWQRQGKYLLAGQIRQHFFLENTGASEMVGVKFKPTTLSKWFGLTMSGFTDKVVDVDRALKSNAASLKDLFVEGNSFTEKVSRGVELSDAGTRYNMLIADCLYILIVSNIHSTSDLDIIAKS